MPRTGIDQILTDMLESQEEKSLHADGSLSYSFMTSLSKANKNDGNYGEATAR